VRRPCATKIQPLFAQQQTCRLDTDTAGMY
jgi:hypothetical protein